MISSLIAAGASLLGTRLINERNMRNYYEVRHYNTPAMQMRRFREAGLNPHLIYTQQNTAEQAPQFQAPDLSALGNMTTELSEFQNIKKTKADTNNVEKQSQMLDQQIEGVILDNILKENNVKYAEQLSEAQIELVRSQIENFRKTWDKLDAEIKKVLRETQRYDINDATDVFNMIMKTKEFDLAIERLGLDKKKFYEAVREFNVTHKKSVYWDEFLKGLLGDNVENSAKVLGNMLKQIIMGIVQGT